MTLDISAIRQRIENSAGRPRTIEDIAHLVVDCGTLCDEVERLRERVMVLENIPRTNGSASSGNLRTPTLLIPGGSAPSVLSEQSPPKEGK